jgi:hypothetical protein
MAGAMKVLRLEIDSAWTSNEFSRLFEEINFLHQAAQFGSVEIHGQADHYFFPRPSQRQRDAWDMGFEFEAKLRLQIFSTK